MEAEVDMCAHRRLSDSSDDFQTSASLPALYKYIHTLSVRRSGGSTAVYFTLARQQAFRLLQPSIEDPRYKNRRAV